MQIHGLVGNYKPRCGLQRAGRIGGSRRGSSSVVAARPFGCIRKKTLFAARTGEPGLLLVRRVCSTLAPIGVSRRALARREYISFEQRRLSGLWAFACPLQLLGRNSQRVGHCQQAAGLPALSEIVVSPGIFSSWIRWELACFDVLRSIWTRARRRLPVIVQRFARSSDPGAAVGRDAGSFPARSGLSARAVFR